MAINIITLSGRLVASPELKYTANGTAVANGRIAVDNGYGETKTTFFFDYTAWKHIAEYMAQYATKGMSVVIQGKLIQNAWQTKDGENRSKTVIEIQEVVLSPKNKTDDNQLYGEEIVFDDRDLPF